MSSSEGRVDFKLQKSSLLFAKAILISALSTLWRASRPVTVVCVVGKYRTGKSYLLNRLMGKDLRGGFPLGATVQVSLSFILWVFKLKSNIILKKRESFGEP